MAYGPSGLTRPWWIQNRRALSPGQTIVSYATSLVVGDGNGQPRVSTTMTRMPDYRGKGKAGTPFPLCSRF